MSDTSVKKNGFSKIGGGFLRFFRDMKSEIKKINWPSIPEIIKNTGIVIGAVIIIGIFVWLIGTLFNYLISIIL